MTYEIYDAFNDCMIEREFQSRERAVSYAFVALAEFLADHIDDELDEGETDVMSICVKHNDDGEWHVWIRQACEMMYRIREKTERTVADLY